MKTFFKSIFLGIESLVLKFKKKKDVVFVVHNPIMYTYCRLIFDKLKADDRMRIWLCFFRPQLFKSGEIKKLVRESGIKMIQQKVARSLRWNLIMFPSHGPYFRNDCPKIYIGHGLYSGKYSDGQSYIFGDKGKDVSGQSPYQKIFVSSHFIGKAVKEYFPQFDQQIKIVGSLLLDELLTLRAQREDVLRAIGFQEERRVVMISTTWGDDALNSNAKEFLDAIAVVSREYNVIISLHYNNFMDRYSRGVRWRKELQKLQKGNMYIIEPNEESFKFLPLADVLVTDITSLGLYFPFLDKPILYFEKPNTQYQKISLSRELRNNAFVINSLTNLSRDIKEAISNFNFLQWGELKEKIASYPEDSWRRHYQEICDSLGLTPLKEVENIK